MFAEARPPSTGPRFLIERRCRHNLRYHSEFSRGEGMKTWGGARRRWRARLTPSINNIDLLIRIMRTQFLRPVCCKFAKEKPPSGPRTADFRAERRVFDVWRVRVETDHAMFDFAVLAI